MTESAVHLLQAALQLPPAERLQFADALWSSVDEASPERDVDASLHELLRQRCEELDSGLVEELSHEEVMAALDQALVECASPITPPSNEN